MIAERQAETPSYVHVVRYHEVDQQGHVYHSRYLEIADAGFSDYLAALLATPYSTLPGLGFDPALVSTSIEFTASARYEDRIAVWVLLTKVGRSSFGVELRLVREQDAVPVATIRTTYVNIDVEVGGSRPIPDAIAEVLRGETLSESTVPKGTAPSSVDT